MDGEIQRPQRDLFLPAPEIAIDLGEFPRLDNRFLPGHARPFPRRCAYMKKSEKAFAAITHGTGVPFVAGRTFRPRGDKERIPKRRAIVRWECTAGIRCIAAMDT